MAKPGSRLGCMANGLWRGKHDRGPRGEPERTAHHCLLTSTSRGCCTGHTMHCLSNAPKRHPTPCTTRGVMVTWRGKRGMRFRPGVVPAAPANQCPPPRLRGGSHFDAHRWCCTRAIHHPTRSSSKPSSARQERHSNHRWHSHPPGQHPVFRRFPRAPLEPAHDGGDGSGGDKRRTHRSPKGGAQPHAASATHAPRPTREGRTKHRRIAIAA